MLYICSSAQIFDVLLCSILCSCKRFVLKKAVLLEYIHLHHKNEVAKVLHTTVAQIIIILNVLLECIDLQSYFQSSTTYYAGIMLYAFSYLLCSKLYMLA